MGLLDLIEQHHRIGPAPNRLGELPGLIVTNVARRRADHPRHGVLLLVLGHVDSHHRLFVVEQELGQRAGEFRLADAGRAEKDEAAQRPVGILQTGARAANGVRDRDDRLVLSHHALVQAVFHLEQLLDFAFHQPAHRNARPLADDFGDILFVDLFLEHALDRLQALQARLLVLDLRLEFRDAAVLQFRRHRVVAGSLGLFHFDPHALELLLELPAGLDRFFLLLPMRAELQVLFLEVGEVLLELLQPLLRGLVLLLAKGLAFDLELHDAAAHLVQFRRHRVDLHAQLRGRLIHQVDGLVGQEAIGNVALRQHGRGDQRRVLELHAVMDLVAFAQPAQDADGVFDRRFSHGHRLEAALERGVLLDVLAVLVDGGRADGVQLAARQHGLQHVRGVHRPLRRASADDGVEFVDEQHDPALGFRHFLEHGLQAILELAAILGAGNQCPHVERDDALVFESFGHVAADDALGEALDNGRLADPGLADQHRVVLGAS